MSSLVQCKQDRLQMIDYKEKTTWRSVSVIFPAIYISTHDWLNSTHLAFVAVPAVTRIQIHYPISCPDHTFWQQHLLSSSFLRFVIVKSPFTPLHVFLANNTMNSCFHFQIESLFLHDCCLPWVFLSPSRLHPRLISSAVEDSFTCHYNGGTFFLFSHIFLLVTSFFSSLRTLVIFKPMCLQESGP